jgi:uncharacterized membrane protein
MISLSLTIHILASVIWVGGMFFAYVLLRPALSAIDQGTIDRGQRLVIWVSVFRKFFPWVWLCIVILLASGFLMISLMGGFGGIGNHVYIMMGLGILMMAIFKFIYVAPFKHLCRGVEEQKWELATYALGTIRKLVATNLVLGILTIAIASGLSGHI